MNKKKEFKGYWYIYIHTKLKEKSIDNTISLTEAKSFLFEWRLPKWLRTVVLKEMENLGMIERIDKNTIKFNNINCDIENISFIFNDVGIYCIEV